jgi:hypothetical protein
MDEQWRNRCVAVVMAASALAIFLSCAAPASAQAQPGSQQQPNRAALLKVKPDLAGFRNGVFIEPDPIDFADHTGYISLFDGKTLAGWDGQPGLWKVEDGVIVGETAPEMFPPYTFPNTFLIYRGIQYRSSAGLPPAMGPGKGTPGRDPRWAMVGPQADFWFPVDAKAKQWTGQLYSQNTSRGIIAWRGQVVESFEGKIPQLVGTIGGRDKLGAFVKDGAWNQYMIIARGGVILHILNGQLMAVLVDDDPASSNNVSGLFGLQIEGVPCKVSFRNLWLKKVE